MPSKSRRATLSDLLIAYATIIVLSVLFYFYSMHYNGYLHPRRSTQRNRSYEVLVKYAQRQLPNEENLYKPEAILVESYLGGKGRSLSCHRCFKPQIKLVVNSTACTAKGNVDVLFLIFSAMTDSQGRDALRKSWLSPLRNNTKRARYVFVLGMSELVENDAQTQQEGNAEGDIIQGNFLEDPHNNTHKMLTGFLWSVRYCAQAKHIAKVNDDTWVNIKHLHATLETVPSGTLIGKCIFESAPDRNDSSPRYTSFMSYALPVFPPFCAGPGYVTSMDTASYILKAVPDIPYFHLDDVYLGMCLDYMNMNVQHREGFVTVGDRTDLCKYHAPEVLFVQGLSVNDIRRLWLLRC